MPKNLTDSKEVTKAKDLNIEVKQDNQMQNALLEIVKRPDIDPDRLEKFLDLQIKMEDRQNKTAFNFALAGFQGDCPVIKKTKKVDFASKNGNKTKYDYAPLDEIVHIIKPILLKWGLSYSFNIEPQVDSSSAKLVTNIYHKDGHCESFEYYFNTLHDDQRMNMSQRAKSALTYAKRAALENALGVVTAGEDDDARRAIDSLITEQQKDNIIDLMTATDTTEAKFFKHMKITKLEDLSKPEADKAIRLLKQKRIASVQNNKL